jgi:hypothetical protein
VGRQLAASATLEASLLPTDPVSAEAVIGGYRDFVIASTDAGSAEAELR